MLAEFVLILCITTDEGPSAFSKIVGYQVGPKQTMEECMSAGKRGVDNLSAFKDPKFICRTRTNKDFINDTNKSDDKECRK